MGIALNVVQRNQPKFKNHKTSNVVSSFKGLVFEYLCIQSYLKFRNKPAHMIIWTKHFCLVTWMIKLRQATKIQVTLYWNLN